MSFLKHDQVREQGQQKGEVSPFLSDLQHGEEQAKQQGVGRWSKVSIFLLYEFCGANYFAWLSKDLIVIDVWPYNALQAILFQVAISHRT